MTPWRPHMSKETLEFHHDKHHQAYVDNGSKAIAGTPYESLSLEEICKKAFAEKNAPIINNAGQHYNHVHFWQWMKKGGGGKKLPGKLQAMVDKDLGGYDKMRTDFVQAGVTQFGSGWAWLAVKDGKLQVAKTPNGENPLMHGATPILGVDVWEHSYYIDYRNARPKYLEAWFDNLVNWEYVEAMLDKGVSRSGTRDLSSSLTEAHPCFHQESSRSSDARSLDRPRACCADTSAVQSGSRGTPAADRAKRFCARKCALMHARSAPQSRVADADAACQCRSPRYCP